MKPIILTVGLLITGYLGNAQLQCKTPHNAFDSGYKVRPTPGLRIGGISSNWPNPPCKKAVIRVAFHLIKGTAGGGFDPSGHPSLPGVGIHNQILNVLNSAFNPHNIFFELKNADINIIVDDYYYNFADNNISPDNVVDGKFDNFHPSANADAIDIYLLANGKWNVHLAADIGASAIIYSGQPGDKSISGIGKAMQLSIVHEMGHCLGLYHTFFQTACNTLFLQNRDYNNAATFCEHGGLQIPGDPSSYQGNGHWAGDYVWDTPSDPTVGVFYGSVAGSCVENISGFDYSCKPNGIDQPTDKYGFPWRPLTNNYMDYSFDANCSLAFTPGQGERMLKAIANDPVVNATVKKETAPPSILLGNYSFCAGDAVNLTASGSPMYYYSWLPEGTGNNLNVTVHPTETTTYTLKGFSPCMNEVEASVEIVVNDNVKLSIQGPEYICETQGGVFYNLVNSGQQNYHSGFWSASGATLTPIPGSDTVKIDVQPGFSGEITLTYTAYANNLDCEINVTKKITIVSATAPISIYASDTIVCAGSTVILFATIPVGASILWDDSSTYPIRAVSPLASMWYRMQLVSACSAYTDSIFVAVNQAPILSQISGMPNQLCVGAGSFPVSCTASPGPGTGHWTVTGGNAWVSPSAATQNTTFFPGSIPDSIKLTYTYTDDNNCIASKTHIVVVSPNVLELTGDDTVCTGSRFKFFANIPNGKWFSNNPERVLVDSSTGVILAKTEGPVTVSYSTSTCGYTLTKTKNLFIKLTPEIIDYAPVLELSQPQPSFYKSNMSGLWQSYPPGMVDISPTTANSLETNQIWVSPLAAGTVQIRFTKPGNTCLDAGENLQVTVLPNTPYVSCENVTSTKVPASLTDTAYSNQLLYVHDNLTINGQVGFYNCQIIMAPEKAIFVSDSAHLAVAGSHIYACNSQWEGIKINPKGRLTVSRYNSLPSFIEDAKTAIYYYPLGADSSIGGSDFLSVDNTIFNRNNTSVEIGNLQGGHSSDSILPVKIYNSIFTSRRIDFRPNVILWQDIHSLKNTSGIPPGATPLSYVAPYLTGLTHDSLKDGAEHPHAAIKITNTGNQSGAKSYVVVGAPPTYGQNAFHNTNIFDNHGIGLRIANSNVIVNNCSFQNNSDLSFDRPLVSGFGININNNSTANSVYINNPPASPPNAFFDMNTAIRFSGVGSIQISGVEIRSSQNATALTGRGAAGIHLSGYGTLNATMENNSIYNVRTGIWLDGRYILEPSPGTLSGPPEEPAPLLKKLPSAIQIKGNKIMNEMPLLTANNTFLRHGIVIGSDFTLALRNNLVCVDNTVKGAVYGINVKALTNGNIRVLRNNIELVADVTAQATDQYGILLEAGNSAGGQGLLKTTVIEENAVTGVNAANCSGIMLANFTGALVGCNTVSNNVHGFRFVGLNLKTKFWDNTMTPDNQYGFTLWEDGVIDKQGNEVSTPQNPHVCASNNSWVNPYDWTGGKFMTFTYESLASKSPLVVRNSAIHPELNPNGYGDGTLGFPGNKYSVTDGTLIYATQADALSCVRCNNPVDASRAGSLLEEIADGTVLLPEDGADERLRVMQQQLYELLREHPEQTANSADLQQFMYNMQWSSLDYIYYAAQYLAEGKMDMVSLLLGSWPGQMGSMDEAFHRYFEWMLNMHENRGWQPELNEVLELANRCPARYGTIVYNVRNLYNALTGEINQFEDRCEDYYNQRRGPKQFIRLKQPSTSQEEHISKLSVYPNPARTSVTVSFKAIKEIRIMDLFGRTVARTVYNGIDNAVNLSTGGLVSGLYLIKVTTASGNSETQKLMIE